MQASYCGLVLSGGRGSRMGGVDKGLLLWHGIPMAEHVCRLLRPFTCEVLVSCNRNQEQYGTFATRLLSDPLNDYPGPLAGILAGLRAMNSSHLLVLPCDLPAISHALMNDLKALSQQHPDRPVVVRQGVGLQPLVCVLPHSIKEAVESVWAAGERSPGRVWQQLQAVELHCAEDDPQLININYPALLAEALEPCTQNTRRTYASN
jgi:molybdopterin-guanine dinucleotide biosynthesis protein A